MRHRLSAVGIALLATLAALYVHEVRAADSAADAALQVFKDKKLVKSGFLLVLSEEADLHNGIRSMRAAKGKLVGETAARTELERSMKREVDTFKAMNTKFGEYAGQLAQSPHDNRVIGAYNAALAQLKAQASKVEALMDRQKKMGDSRAIYVGFVLDLSEKAAVLTTQYDELAKDDDLKSAIHDFNETASPQVKLGPSGNLEADLTFLRQCRGEVTSEVIHLNFEGGTPRVDVVLNGKVKRVMAWDSGAALVTLDDDTARELGLHPTQDDPTLRLKVADGREVDAKLVVLDSVRVGGCVAENVECAILPAGMAGSLLLGDTFQRHFVCRLDQQLGQLHLTPLAPSKAAPGTRDEVAGKTPGAPPGSDPNPTEDTPEMKPQEKVVAPREKIIATTAKPAKGPIDLLQLINVRRDSVAGTWSHTSGELAVTKGDYARLEFRYTPPEEYDFKATFTCTEGAGPIIQMCPMQHDGVVWSFDAAKMKFESHSRSVAAGKGPFLKPNISYVSIVRVRKDKVQAYLNDKLVCEFDPSEREVSVSDFWRLNEEHALGIGAGSSSVIFSKVELIEVTGHGKVLK